MYPRPLKLLSFASVVSVVAIIVCLAGCAEPPESVESIMDPEPPAEQVEIELPEGAKPLSEILQSLEEQGYKPIVEVGLEESSWEIEAYKDGRRMKVSADLTSGQVLVTTPPVMKRTLSVLVRILEQGGYGPILAARLEDGAWEIEANRDGETVVLTVDPATGKIQPE